MEQGRSLTQLIREDLRLQIAARLAAHLLANEDIVVRVNGEVLDARRLIEGEPEDVPVDDTAEAQTADRSQPVLTLVDWTEEMRRAPGLVLCNEDGMALLVLDKPASSAAVKSTGYLKWSEFGQNADLTLATMQYPDLIAEATRLFEQHVKARLGEVTATVVSRLVADGIYPYATAEIDDPIKRTERDMFDLVAVAARSALNTGNRQQRDMSARLLKLALEERPETLDIILSEAFDLEGEDRDQIADMLRVFNSWAHRRRCGRSRSSAGSALHASALHLWGRCLGQAAGGRPASPSGQGQRVDFRRRLAYEPKRSQSYDGSPGQRSQ